MPSPAAHSDSNTYEHALTGHAPMRKAERFIRTLLGGWAYGAIYNTSRERNAALTAWIDFYNHRRPHGSLGRQPPAARLAQLNNAHGSYT